MIDGSPSRTALMVAAMRAFHHHFAPEPKLLRDSLAMELAGFKSQDELKDHVDGLITVFAGLSDPETAAQFVLHISHSVCARSALVEAELAAGQNTALVQLVILGAGLDSTAYRCADLTDGMAMFEVDHPATQTWKRERLADIGADIPKNLTYVPFDFERQTLAQALKEGGVAMDKPTLFPWLGVQPYLTHDAVVGVLDVVASFPAGSRIVMDFVSPDYGAADGLNDDGLAQLGAVVSQMGEPFLSRYAPKELETLLKQVGFGSVDFYPGSRIIERFLGGDASGYTIPGDVTAILSAAVG